MKNYITTTPDSNEVSTDKTLLSNLFIFLSSSTVVSNFLAIEYKVSPLDTLYISVGTIVGSLYKIFAIRYVPDHGGRRLGYDVV